MLKKANVNESNNLYKHGSIKIFYFILGKETRLINMRIAVVAIRLKIHIVPVPKTNELLFNNPNPS
jgi:hypothetical protein